MHPLVWKKLYPVISFQLTPVRAIAYFYCRDPLTYRRKVEGDEKLLTWDAAFKGCPRDILESLSLCSSGAPFGDARFGPTDDLDFQSVHVADLVDLHPNGGLTDSFADAFENVLVTTEPIPIKGEFLEKLARPPALERPLDLYTTLILSQQWKDRIATLTGISPN